MCIWRYIYLYRDGGEEMNKYTPECKFAGQL